MPVGARRVLVSGRGSGGGFSLTAPFDADLTAWYDASHSASLFQETSSPSTPSVAGDVVGTVQDRKGTYHMAAPADGNRGTLVDLDGYKRIRLRSAETDRFTNASIPINRRACAVFVVGRNFGSGAAQALVHFPASGSSSLALYNNDGVQITADPVYVYHGAAVNTGLKYGYRGSLETAFVMGGAAAAYAGIGGELYTRGSAWTAGTATGGNIGYWNAAFPANYEICEVLVYGRELTIGEKDDVLDYLEAKWPVVKASETHFLCVSGDSITAGSTLPNVGDTDSYLVQMLPLFTSPPKTVNAGVGSQKIQTNTAAAGEVAALAGAAAYANRVLVCLFGTNDIAAARTSTQVNADIDTFLASVATGDAGASIMFLSILPRDGFDATQDGYVADVNAHLASLEGTTIDWYVDLGADARLSDSTNTTYYNVDAIHLNTAGTAVVAELVHARLVTEGWAV